MFIFDVEGGCRSLVPYLKGNDQITIVKIENFNDLMVAMKQIAQAETDVATIAIDSLSMLQTFSTNDKFLEKEQLTQRDWGESLQALRNVTKTMIRSDINFVCIAHEADGDVGTKDPGFSGQMKKEAPHYFDFVLRASIDSKTNQYIWHTKSSIYTCKLRGLELPEKIPQDFAILLNNSLGGENTNGTS